MAFFTKAAFLKVYFSLMAAVSPSSFFTLFDADKA